MNKPPGRSFARPLRELVGKTISDAFARQGFAATELLTRWEEIVGPEIAGHAEPIRMNWPRRIADDPEPPEPATLILRVEGPAAIEIQHLSGLILERVNRFFGWRAVGRIALRQAPLARRRAPKRRPPLDPAEAARIAADMTDIKEIGRASCRERV